MIPSETDARWAKMLNSIGTVPINNLSTRMLMSRLKVMIADKTDASRKRAISAAYEFFTKNESLVRDDLRQLFG